MKLLIMYNNTRKKIVLIIFLIFCAVPFLVQAEKSPIKVGKKGVWNKQFNEAFGEVVYPNGEYNINVYLKNTSDSEEKITILAEATKGLHSPFDYDFALFDDSDREPVASTKSEYGKSVDYQMTSGEVKLMQSFVEVPGDWDTEKELWVNFVIKGPEGKVIEGTTGGGGGGGAFLFQPSEEEEELDIIGGEKAGSVNTDSASANWETNKLAQCRLVYDIKSHSELEEAPSYGYSSYTESTSEGTSHQITLTDLLPDTTYYYRVVCWSSPDKVSDEYSFTTAVEEETGEETETEEGEETEEEVIPEGEGPIPEEGEQIVLGPEEETPEEPSKPEEEPSRKTSEEEPGTSKQEPSKEPEQEPDTGLAALANLLQGIDLFNCLSCLSWWLILLFAGFALFRVYSGFKDFQQEQRGTTLEDHYRNKAIGWLGATILLVILSFVFSGGCVPVWLFVLVSVLTIAGLEVDSSITTNRIENVGTLRGDFELVSKTKISVVMWLMVAVFVGEGLILDCITLVLIPLYFVGLALLDIREWRIHHEEQY